MAMVVSKIEVPDMLANHGICVAGDIACESGLGYFANIAAKDGEIRIIIRHPDLTEAEIKAAMDRALKMTEDRMHSERQTGICGRCGGTGEFTWSDQETPPNGIEHD